MLQQSLEQLFAIALQHHQAGRLAAAEPVYRQILQRDPRHADALHLLGVIALQTGNLDAALQLVRAALDVHPAAAIYRNSLGQVLERKGRYADAAEAYAAALQDDPRYPEAHNNLGHVLERQDRLEEAETHYRAAIRLDPQYAEPHTNLGNVLKDRGALDEAIASYRRAVELRPDLSFLHSNLLLTLHYHAGFSASDLAREHRAWAERHVAPLASALRPHTNRPDPERRLRIGYVSPDFREHAVTRFVLPILAAHDRHGYEIHAYADTVHADAVTMRIRDRVEHWRDISALTDAQLADVVRGDGIDVLVDLAAHSGRNRLLTFARKPAPVQVTYLAYCSTTGVTAIDYRLTDRYLDPPGGNSALYTETSMSLPGCYWCYSAPDIAPEALPPATRRDGAPTFGSLNNYAKVTDAALRVWLRLLRAVPESTLLLYARADAHRERVLDALRSVGESSARVEFVGYQSFAAYLDTYRRIDVALDPFPFTGGTTTCDALWMGVPVITLAGATAVSRSGSSLLSHIGLGDLVAHSEDEYVALAAGLLQNAPRRAELRRDLRGRLEASPVMDAVGFTRGLEAAYRKMWHAWCAGEKTSRQGSPQAS